MHRTFFTTPGLDVILRAIAVFYMWITGWKVVGKLPPEAAKSVVIAAPHTSNWDLPYTLMSAFHLRMKIYWMGKKSIFKPPFGALMMWMGGVPVNREKSNNMVAASAEALQNAQGPMQLVVPPEGTRSRTEKWKTGFYHIALQAKVPIVMAYLDYGTKTAGLGPLFWPTGDVEKDIAEIRAFYAPFRGKYADQFHTGQS